MCKPRKIEPFLPLPATDHGPPDPDPDASLHSRRLQAHIADAIADAGGWISFARFMELALYAPGLGYYSGGARKFGAAGDFVTAPELTPAFAQSLATQVAQIMAVSAADPRGRRRLRAARRRPAGRTRATWRHARALSDSRTLRRAARTAATDNRGDSAAPAGAVHWLDACPRTSTGWCWPMNCSTRSLRTSSAGGNGTIAERGVSLGDDGFEWVERPATAAVLARGRELSGNVTAGEGYLSEIGLAAAAWTASWAAILGRGALLLIDYGFPRRGSITHPAQRRHADVPLPPPCPPDPFFLPGLQDITVHVDFTAIAEAGTEAGLDFLGYTIRRPSCSTAG